MRGVFKPCVDAHPGAEAGTRAERRALPPMRAPGALVLLARAVPFGGLVVLAFLVAGHAGEVDHVRRAARAHADDDRVEDAVGAVVDDPARVAHLARAQVGGIGEPADLGAARAPDGGHFGVEARAGGELVFVPDPAHLCGEV